ncbi:MAG TPA: nucleotide exchange factor GrpE [Streptosporangiaceae bacterium]|jgi:molecular chaperone GrpE
MSSAEETHEGPVIRDRRRIDPATGQVREPDPASSDRVGTDRAAAGQPFAGGRRAAGGQGGQGGQGAGTQGPPAEDAADSGAVADQLAERTADLQRLQAEYSNYRKRVERDRTAVREQALASVLAELLPTLDDIGRAREHGELSGGFKSVAESVESAVTKLGLVSYGEKGEPFDPMVHEALMHSYSNDVTEPTCVQVLQPGYKIGDRILRPARVAVAEPGDDEPGGDEPAAGDDAPQARGGASSQGASADSS